MRSTQNSVENPCKNLQFEAIFLKTKADKHHSTTTMSCKKDFGFAEMFSKFLDA
jgi:hypothetical protein